MKVYILLEYFEYEGENIIDVFESYENAEKEKQKLEIYNPKRIYNIENFEIISKKMKILNEKNEWVNNEWFNIEITPPKFNTYVLFSNGKEMAIGHLIPTGYFYLLGTHTAYSLHDQIFKITHWMPLPELPIKEK